MKHILFLCIGNSCRSQMAEGFARAYGGDVVQASSAGLSPASFIAPLTREVMAEKGISLDDHFPKPLNMVDLRRVDLIVNMSGMPLVRDPGVPVQEWRVDDPIGQNMEKFRQVANQIEHGVMQMIVGLRGPGVPAAQQPRREPASAGPGSTEQKRVPPKFGRPRIPRS